MQDWTIKLISQQYVIDEVGNQILQKNYIEVPIIEVQDVYASEFYTASQQGLKPTLRVLISNLNYNDEEELIYLNKQYVIIRVDMVDNENIALICEKRVGNNAKNS
jgi:SPP1 family predicted phage head-tail adaptor